MFLLYVDYFDMRIKWVGHFFQMVDLHSNSNFLISFYMIHPRDVIKISCKEVGQKAESNLFSKLEKVFTFLTHFQQTNIKVNVSFAMVSPKHYQIVRILPISLNHLSNHFSKVQERKIPKLSQINLITIVDVSFIILFCLSYQ